MVGGGAQGEAAKERGGGSPFLKPEIWDGGAGAGRQGISFSKATQKEQRKSHWLSFMFIAPRLPSIRSPDKA